MTEALAVLRSLGRQALVERWQAAFGQPAPRYCHLELLRAALAWEMQVPATPTQGTPRRRIMRALAASKQPARLTPGTQLLREWNGRTHRVGVLAEGFDYDGKIYRSLTAIARAITGTPWSGPRFFGLRQ